jgi:hypothetical protein
MLKIHRFLLLAGLLSLAGGLIVRPAFAQMDLSGGWAQKTHEDAPERGAGPEIGDYTGMPINDEARSRADSWDAQKWEMIEHECEPHPADYAVRGPGSMRITADIRQLDQQVTAWHTQLMWMLPQRTIYMDNRPHPPEYAPHTWQGFSTGEWVADMLKVTTTHMKEGWLRRNGLPRSDKATMTEFYIRHGSYFTVATIVDDPIYLTETFIRTSNWIQTTDLKFAPMNCIPSNEIQHPRGYVAHHLPGENQWLGEYPSKYGIPVEAARGGAETMYPEYLPKMAAMPPPPKFKESTENR